MLNAIIAGKHDNCDYVLTVDKPRLARSIELIELCEEILRVNQKTLVLVYDEMALEWLRRHPGTNYYDAMYQIGRQVESRWAYE